MTQLGDRPQASENLMEQCHSDPLTTVIFSEPGVKKLARSVGRGRYSWDACSTPESSPIGRRRNGSRRGAVNPEVLRSGGPGDSFEWNRADSSPVRLARAGPSPSCCCRCRRRRVIAPGRQGSRPRPPAPPAFRREREGKKSLGKNYTC
ncbi:hypothetical protein ABFV05_001468 [Capra hircus]